MRDLQPLTLSAAAKALGLDPFDLIRLAVGTETDLKSLQFSDAQLDELRQSGGIDSSWWTAETSMPADHNPKRQIVRAALGQLIERGHVGGLGTRMDNVWRGLKPDDQDLLREALTALAAEELLVFTSTRTGTHVAVADSGRSKISDIAAGTADTSALSALYED